MLYPHWIDTRNVAMHLGDFTWIDHTIQKTDDLQAHVRDGANKLFILNVNDAGNLQTLQDLFPNGQLRVFRSQTPNHDFNLWYVPGTAPPDAFLGTVGR
jgi:hypothetical protein